MTYSHLQSDCLYTGSAPDPTLGNEYGAFTFLPNYNDKRKGKKLNKVTLKLNLKNPQLK